MGMRKYRRKYYDIFSRFYDAFIAMHSRDQSGDLRQFPVAGPFKTGGLGLGYLHRDRVSTPQFTASGGAKRCNLGPGLFSWHVIKSAGKVGRAVSSTFFY